MRWRTWARAVIAAAGVALAVGLYWQIHRRPSVGPQPPVVRREAGADYQGQGGEQVRLRDNKETSDTKYDRVTHYPDGRTLMEQPHILMDRGDRKYEISGDRSESHTSPGQDVSATPKEITFIGHVKVAASDGFTLTCATATYETESGIVNVPGRAAFSRGRLSGGGDGATYDHGVDTLVLLDRSEIDMKADPEGHGRLHATSKTMTLMRPTHTLSFGDHAVLVRDGQTMRGDQAAVALTDDDERVKRIELRGQSSVVQPATAAAAATTMRAYDIDLDFVPEESRLQATDLRGEASLTQPPTAKAAPPQMKAETIHVEFQPDGRAARRAVLTERAELQLSGTDNGKRNVRANAITATLSADGARATGLNAQGGVIVDLPESADAPARQIRGERLEADGNDKDGLTSAVFKPDAADKSSVVSLSETQKADPKRDRQAMSRHLLAAEMDFVLNGDIGAIEKASFLGNFSFKSGNGTTASAGQGRFIEASGRLSMAAFPAKAAGIPKINTDRLWVTAGIVELMTKENDLTASQDVVSLLYPDTTKAAAGAAGLFDTSQKINATADKLVYTDKTADAEYTGNAHVWQGNNDVRAGAVKLGSRSGNLTATGGVRTVFVLDRAPGATAASKPGASAPTGACQIAGASCASAASMVYDDGTRAATYATDATFIGSGGTAMMADTIKLALGQEGRALDRIEADGSVVANLDGDHQVQGGHLVYAAATETYAVVGAPLISIQRSVDKGKETCSVSRGQRSVFQLANDALKRRAGGQVFGPNNQVVSEEQAPSCAAVLKVIK